MHPHQNLTDANASVALVWIRPSRNTWLACSYYHFLMDAAGDPQAVQSCHVQSEGVKNESKGLQETGLPARSDPDYYSCVGLLLLLVVLLVLLYQCTSTSSTTSIAQ